jgi:hypothetical protein
MKLLKTQSNSSFLKQYTPFPVPPLESINGA